MDEAVSGLTISLDVMWVLIAAFLVFFMQAGFALVEGGFTRKKNIAHTMMMNLMVFCIGAIGYYLCGFAFQFGGVNHLYPATPLSPEWSFAPVTLGSFELLGRELVIGGQGLMGLKGFLLTGMGGSTGILAFFLFQMVFMDTAATIPTGSMAERLKFSGFVLMGAWVSMVIYPILGGWVWGGGWLANLGRSVGLGNGAVDFAGSGVVHMIGGAVGLAGAMVLGPRIGKFDSEGKPQSIPGHNIALGIAGTIILFFGWFGFNPGSSLGVSGVGINFVAKAAVNTLLAGAAGGIAAMAYLWAISPIKKPDPALSVNGVLAGLVAVTAPCAFIDTSAAVIIGLVAGVLVCLATEWLERAKIDDPVGAVPVHLVNGMWGVIAVGIFANGDPLTAGWNGVATPVSGLVAGNLSQLGAQVIEAAAIGLIAWGTSYLFFRMLHARGLLRVSAADEIAGLDMPEMGSQGYPEDLLPAPQGLHAPHGHAPVGAPAFVSAD